MLTFKLFFKFYKLHFFGLRCYNNSAMMQNDCCLKIFAQHYTSLHQHWDG